MQHLTDNQLQDYLERGADDAMVEEHLSACPQCREALEVYRLIFAAAAEEADPVLSGSFTDQVTERLVAAAPVHRPYLGVLGAAAAALVLATLYYFTSSFDILARLGLQYWIKFNEWGSAMTSWTGWFDKLGVRPELLLVAVLILTLFGLLDRVLHLARRGKAMFLA